jgi:starch-binding outer membrane protein, SusD/RagB family
MNRPRSLGLLLGLALGAAGCDDAFLNTVPTDRIREEAFWKTEQDFTYAINAAYRNIIGPVTIYFDNPSDLGYSQQYWADLSDIARSMQDALSGTTRGFWVGLYQGIAKANEVLAQLETVQPGVLSPVAATQIKGQALFLRGYYYHELLWLFGGVPLLTSVPSVEEARQATRASRAEVFERIMSDLTAAAGMLPNSWPAAQRGRATKGAALAYQARTALYEAGYQKYTAGDATEANRLFGIARDAAQAVMDLAVYQLYPDFRALFTYAGEGSSEVIFDYQVNTGQNGWWAWADFAPRSQGGQEVALSPTRALVDKFYMTDGLLPQDSPLYDSLPPVIRIDTVVTGTDTTYTQTVVSLGMYANRDPRFYATVLFPGAQNLDGSVFNSYPRCSVNGAPGYCSITAEALDLGNFYNTFTGYLPLKYLDPADKANSQNSGLNVIKLRYADVLLMYAEARMELGEWADASVAGALNQIRDRVSMPHVTLTSQQQAIDLVRNERAVELAFEGLRFADLRRWRIADAVMPGFARGIDYIDRSGQRVTARSDIERPFRMPRDYLWPIPSAERDLNPQLAQNPGY